MAAEKQLLFSLGEESYGINIFQVEEIVKGVAIEPPPTPSKHILGMIQWRGQAVLVYSLRARFGLPKQPVGALVVAKAGGLLLALAVDQVSEILELEDSEAYMAPVLLHMADTAYVDKIVQADGGLVVLLNLEGLMANGEKERVQAMLKK